MCSNLAEKKDGGGWAGALLDIVKNPRNYASDIVYQDEDVLIIKDKYPKARVHLLCMPKEVLVSLRIC